MVAPVDLVAVFAGGRGTRLFGADGGSKAMALVGTEPLIGYVLNEALDLGCRRVALAADPADTQLIDYVESLDFDEVTHVPSLPGGTMQPVRDLIEIMDGSACLLSTCDVYGPRGSVKAFVDRAALERANRASVVFCGTSVVNDDKPIWIHANVDGSIADYGKRIAPSGIAFANIRLCFPDFRDLVRSIPINAAATDTEMMGILVKRFPNAARCVTSSELFDVDTPHDLQRAKEINRP